MDIFLRRRIGMPTAGSLWDTHALKTVVAEWYGVPNMPMHVLTREEEIEAFQRSLPDVPDVLWDLVSHDARLLRRWACDDCFDLVIWDGTFKLVQDVCFKEAYPDDVAWRKAIFDLIHTPGQKVWCVLHE